MFVLRLSPGERIGNRWMILAVAQDREYTVLLEIENAIPTESAAREATERRRWDGPMIEPPFHN